MCYKIAFKIGTFVCLYYDLSFNSKLTHSIKTTVIYSTTYTTILLYSRANSLFFLDYKTKEPLRISKIYHFKVSILECTRSKCLSDTFGSHFTAPKSVSHRKQFFGAVNSVIQYLNKSVTHSIK